MSTQIQLLSDASNYAVVQMTSRRYPGVVVQGDSLYVLTQDVDEMARLFRAKNYEELDECINNFRQNLLAIKSNYEAVCRAQNINLPYFEES